MSVELFRRGLKLFPLPQQPQHGMRQRHIFIIARNKSDGPPLASLHKVDRTDRSRGLLGQSPRFSRAVGHLLQRYFIMVRVLHNGEGTS